MITVIIPTLWKSERIFQLLDSFDRHPLVKEILIVDNAVSDGPKNLPHRKLKHIPQEQNIYVNPSFNLGIDLAVSEFVCICNDDVSFDSNILERAIEYCLPGVVIGCHKGNFGITGNTEVSLHPETFVGAGWGCVLFLRKREYVHIPEEIKIWCGDSWIELFAENPVSLRFSVQTEMSSSSGSPILKDIKHRDVKLYNKLQNELSFLVKKQLIKRARKYFSYTPMRQHWRHVRLCD